MTRLIRNLSLVVLVAVCLMPSTAKATNYCISVFYECQTIQQAWMCPNAIPYCAGGTVMNPYRCVDHDNCMVPGGELFTGECTDGYTC